MKNIFHHIKKHSTHVVKHLHKHKHRYALGTFGTFAVVKMFVLLVGAVGVFQLENTFAAGTELNNENIITTYGCPTDATECDLSSRGITSIAENTFINHTELTTLYLYSNQISSIESEDFAGLTSLTNLNLYNNQITSIESGDFAGLTSLTNLNIGGNQISSIESGDFAGLTSLQQLYLNNNQISSIESGDFAGLTSLTNLNLQSNQISSIESGDFAGLTSLTILDIQSNQISSLESGDFAGLDSLTTLYLYDNQISSIESGDFAGLTSLTNLDIGSNQITSIESGTFAGLDSLTILDIQSNQITSIESGDFASLDSLTNLNLNNNQITSIESGDFMGLSNLERLSLHSNQITSIENGDFTGLTSLRDLILYNNQITSIESGDFAGLDSLLSLRLYSNQIASIESGSFMGLDSLYELHLNSNILSLLPEDVIEITNLTTLNLSTNCRDIGSMSTGLVEFLDEKVGSSDWQTSINPSCPVPTFCSTVTDVSEAECEILSGFYYSTNGASWTTGTNWLSGTTVEDWYGVTVSSGQVSQINLSNNNLSGHPYLPGLTGLNYLRLNSNKITSIESGDFVGLTALTDLYLNNNQITSIESGGFIGLSSLTYLRLYNNQITSIESGGFIGLSSLTTLYLNSNQITSIESGDFSGLTGLTTLNLFSNQIASIESGDFAGLDSLNILYLYDNQIASIESGDFVGLTSLTYLSLSNNLITSIESESFMGLGNLTTLTLFSNQISSIESGTFNGLSALTELRLNNNLITSIESGDFVGLGSLTYLYLFSNEIASIESGAFAELISLEYLGLDDNLLTTLPEDTTELVNLTELNLSTNCRDTGSMSTGLVEFLDEKVGNSAWQTSENPSCPIPTFCSTVTDVSEAECEILSGFYYSTNGASWTRSDNWLSGTTVEDWQGVTVSGGQVSQIDLGGYNLSGHPYLSGLTGLTNLALNNNSITSIESGDFVGLTSLQQLYLYNNQISSIESGDFAGLTSLQQLYLQSNQISSIESGDFAGLTSLTNLDIGGNDITSLESGDFAGLTSLQQLYLNYNHITSIESGDFAGLTSLQQLYLNNNQISSIESGDFAGLTSLTSLNLQSNQITSIDFSDITKLTHLYLDSNQLTGLSEDLMNLIDLQGQNLNIYNNYINYYLLSDTLLNFIDTKHVTYNGDWRPTQTFTLESNDYLCGNTTCEEGGYCALVETGVVSCNDYVSESCPTSNGCSVETVAQTCEGGKFDCGIIGNNQSDCSLYNCSWDEGKGSCANPGTPLTCESFVSEPCPTSYGCKLSAPAICTGTFDEISITQEQCGAGDFIGEWKTEDVNSCPVDCTEEITEGELSNTVNGIGYFSGLVFSKSANVTGVVSGDIINYTFNYENTAMDTLQFGVYIKEYFPIGLTFISSSGTTLSGYVDHEVVYGGEDDVCFQQFLDSTGVYYQLLDDALLGGFHVNTYDAMVGMLGYTGSEADVGQAFYDNVCVGQMHVTNLQDCFNNLDFNEAIQYSYPQLMPIGSDCGVVGDELEQPYYYRYIGFVGTGERGTITFSAQYNGNGTGNTLITNQAEYYINKTITRNNEGTKKNNVFTGVPITLNTLITPIYNLEITKTLLTDGPYTAGMQVEYQIDYMNRGNLPLSFEVEERPDQNLSLISFSEDYDTVTPKKLYGVTGDSCYDNYLNETGVYMDAVDGRALKNNGDDGFTGTTAYEFFLYYYNSSKGQTIQTIWDEQENTLAEFIVAVLAEMMPERTRQEAMLAALEIDITTLDKSCGLQEGTPYYAFSLDNFALGTTRSSTLTMQIADDVEVGETVNNTINVIYSDGSGDIEKTSTASLEISSSDNDNDTDDDADNNASTPNGGGGGGAAMIKDICGPADCSTSYYDRDCGGCPGDTIIEYLTQTGHTAAPIEGMQCNQYNNELNIAYNFALIHAITTIADCEKANLNGELLRSHMAKMMSNFAVNTLGLKPNTGTVCEFTDMDNETAEMKFYAKLACQLGLMGLDTDGKANTTFTPNEIVTRAQFGTVLSRLLRGTKNNGGKIYYQKHLQALKDADVMTKIDTPSAKELRGWTMLMMQRIMAKSSSIINMSAPDRPIWESVIQYFEK